MTGIYRIYDTVTNKSYIGQSKNIYHRWQCHKYDLKNNRHNNEYLQKAYNENPCRFVYDVLCLCNDTELNKLEDLYISLFRTADRKYGYNVELLSSGKDRIAEETKKKISALQMGNKYMVGVKLSDTWRKHLSEAQPHKKKIKCIDTGEIYESFAEAARKTGLNRTKIVAVCTGHRNKTGGLRFAYANETASP